MRHLIKTYALLLLFLSPLLPFITEPSYGYENLIPNPEFLSPEGKNPFFWHHGSSGIEGVKRSVFSTGMAGNPPLASISITGGEDREGYWFSRIENISPHTKYILHFKAFRDRFINGYYPSFEIFGVKIRLNNHATYGGWQDFTFSFDSGESTSTRLVFYNDHPIGFSFSSPVLFKASELDLTGRNLSPKRNVDKRRLYSDFTLGVYGATLHDLEDVRELGFNTVVIGYDASSYKELLERLARNNIRAVLWPLKDIDSLKYMTLDEKHILGWYIDDEPELRSVPLERIIQKINAIEKHVPNLPYFMAIVRPEYVTAYSEAADVIMMDQYPIPNEPMTWLSESLDISKTKAPNREIWAVVQAFGGKGWEEHGWPDLPDYSEMKVLSYLSIVHGAKGLFYYTYWDMKENAGHRENMRRLLKELSRFGGVFLSENSARINYLPLDLYRTGFDGKPPVHARIFRTAEDEYYLFAVNTMNRRVSGQLTGIPDGIRYLDDSFSGKRYVVKDNNLMDKFDPYEVKVYFFSSPPSKEGDFLPTPR